jgi:hypothetical protein
MTARDAVRYLLVNDANVASDVAARWYPPSGVPQGVATGTQAYGVIRTVSTRPGQKMDGPDGFVEARIQVDVYAPTQTVVDRIGENARLALSGWRGSIGGFVVKRIFDKGENDDFAAVSGGTPDGLARNSHDYTVWFTQAQPGHP